MRLNFSFFDPGLRYRCHVMCYCAWLWMELPVTQSLDSFFFSAAKKKFKRRVQMTKVTLENRTNSQKIRVKTASISHLNTSAFLLFAKTSFLPCFNNNYFEWIIKQLYSFIHSSVRTLVRSSVDLFIRPNPSVLLLVRSVVRSFVLRSFVRPSVHSFIYPLVCSFSLFMCSEDVTYIKQNHRRSSEHGAPFSWTTIQI